MKKQLTTKQVEAKIKAAYAAALKSQSLIDELRDNSEAFLYSCNSNALSNRIDAAVGTLENYNRNGI